LDEVGGTTGPRLELRPIAVEDLLLRSSVPIDMVGSRASCREIDRGDRRRRLDRRRNLRSRRHLGAARLLVIENWSRRCTP
jgi:hypothetical protein